VWIVLWWLTHGGAALDVEAADRSAVVHGVESCDFVDTHWWHFEQARDFVHHADAGEAVLSLAEVEERHDGGLFVLRWVAREDLFDELLVLGVELEGDTEVVLWTVTMLDISSVAVSTLRGTCSARTTKRESPPLLTGADAVKARVCARNVGRSALEALLKANGASLEAMANVVVEECVF